MLGIRFENATPETIYNARQKIRDAERKAREYAIKGYDHLYVQQIKIAKEIRAKIFKVYGILIE